VHLVPERLELGATGWGVSSKVWGPARGGRADSKTKQGAIV
jgi:hypothetical protein